IIDLELAPKDVDGCARFEADFSLIKPVDLTRTPRRLLVELPNRGRKRAADTFNRTGAPASASPPPGDGFLFNHGFSVASIGWQWDVYRDDVLMGLEAPQADISGDPDPGRTVVEIRPNDHHRTHVLADRVHRPLRVADDDPDAALYVRDYEDGPDSEVPRSLWRFARESAAGIVASDQHIYLEAGFEAGKIYQVVYATRDAPVAGTGLLALRDVASFLRYGPGPLLAGIDGFDHVLGYGVSQTGRMLRHFLYLGLNVDEHGRKVFDGLLPHIAGARRGAFNHRFAQPSNQSYPNFGHLFPFADEALGDPLTDRHEGLLSRLEPSVRPKVLYTNTSAEYWRGDCSLMHTDPEGKVDIDGHEDARIYHFAGTQHGSGTLEAEVATEGAVGRHRYNVVDYSPLLRGALMNLLAWVEDGAGPPPSSHPRIDDGTAVQREEVLSVLGRIPGQATPDPTRLWVIRAIDLGPRAAQGIGSYPTVESATYPCLVPSVDEDGNELCGIRLPDITQPVATHAGWNLRAPEIGAPEQQLPMKGFTRWFAVSQEARGATGDRRRSIGERYPDATAYERVARNDARRLVEQGYVLAEDLELAVRNAIERYEYALE
ncbi:MAG: alpha/beta hydrolase domain-containing protein, partial [Pseudomonadales bacterium]